MRYTLRQAVNKLQDIATSHKQIKGFYFGDIAQLGASEPVQYPIMCVDAVPSSTEYKMFNISVRLTIMDRVSKDDINELDVLSDVLLMLEDVITLLRDEDNAAYFLIPDDLSMEPFEDSQGDETAGWTMILTFNTPTTYNICAVPSN